MCFGSKKDNLHNDPPPRPAPGQAPQQPTYAPEQKASVPPQYQAQQQPLHPQPPAPTGLHPSGNDYAPPPGPPPSHSHGAPMAPSNDDYAPPPGPPPTQRQEVDLSYMAPPPGPPPSSSEEGKAKPQQHDWESVVPDTALFPPPPSFFSGWDRSPATNATEAEAEAGERWCAQHPLAPPAPLDPPAVAALRAHNPRLMLPAGFRGSLVCVAPGVWEGRTEAQAGDTTIIAYPPLYSVTQHSPLSSAAAAPPSSLPFKPHPSNPFSASASSSSPPSKTIYYEVQVTHPSPLQAPSLALGFAALPYPAFRMPGWHRGSLAVHGDDGHRYVNDRWGGRSFTSPFVRGERYGVGMTFTAVNAAGAGGLRIETDVFFTRQGREAGRWDLHEETDAQQDLPVVGLEGYHDLSCAIGTYGAVGFKLFLRPEDWLYKPAGY